MNYLGKNLSVYDNYADTERIRSATPPVWYLPTKGKNGDKMFSVQKAGKVAEVFDAKAPRKYAKELANAYSLAKTEAMVLIGAGVGHELDRIFRKAESGFTCLLVEPNLYLLKEALSNYDMKKHLEAKRLILATTKDEATTALGYINHAAVVEDWYIAVNPYVAILPEEYFDISDHVGHALNAIRCNTGTMAGAGGQIAHNDLANLPYLIQFPGVQELKDIYKGRPAVVVSTGPSLERNVHLLLDQKVRESVVVICVAQAARILLAYGITPDYMATVDYGEVNASHFSGLEECGVPLIALNKTYAPIFTKWKSPLYIAVSNNQPRNIISDVWLSRGSVEQGGSVSHFALGIALHLGCTRVALIGQDLAYEGDKSHSPLADSSGGLQIADGMIDWKIDDPRSTLYDKHYSMGPAIPVEGYFGDPVVTNTGLASFIYSFTAIAGMFKAVRFFNCTEGGAYIPGYRSTTLRSYLDRYAKHPFPHLHEQFRMTDTWQEEVKAALKFATADMATLRELIGYAKTGLETDDTLETFVGNKHRKTLKEYGDALKENERVSKAAHERAKQNPLLESAIYKASREIAGKELLVSGKHLDKDDDAFATRIKRNRHILEAAKTESEKLLTIYETVEGQLKQILADPDALRNEQPPAPSLQDAEAYLQKGNWGLPLLEYRRMAIHEVALFGIDVAEDIKQRCEAMREAAIQRGEDWQEDQPEREKRLRFLQLVNNAKHAGSRDKNFRKSYLCLLAAHHLFPDDTLAWYGLASSATMCKRYETALTYYDKLLEDKPDFEQYRFERVLVLLSMGAVDEGFQDLEALLETNSEQYAHALSMAAEIFATVKGDKEQAAKVMRRYLEQYPQNPEGWRKLHEWTGDEKAKLQWQRLSR